MQRLPIHLNNLFVLGSFALLMTLGLVVDSRPIIEELSSQTPLSSFASLFVIMATFTPTNLLGLSVVAAYIGEQTSHAQPAAKQLDEIESAWCRAVFRGLVVFATVFFLGNYLEQSTVLYATQQDYCKLASGVIVAGFGLGGTQPILAARKQ